MKAPAWLLLFLVAISALAGYLLSKASWVGRMGMSIFYKEYTFLKVWWKGAGVVLGILLLLYGIQSIVQRQARRHVAMATHATCLLLALAGMFFTYQDFRNDISHRWMGERFHLGAYCFWVGWMAISLYLLWRRSRLTDAPDARRQGL